MEFKEKEMYICSPENGENSWKNLISDIPEDFNGFIFYKIRRDSIGKSGRRSYMGRCV